jgi:hypothetical protein
VTPAEQASHLQSMFTAAKTTYAGYVRAVFVYRYNDLSATRRCRPTTARQLQRQPKPAFAVLQANAA